MKKLVVVGATLVAGAAWAGVSGRDGANVTLVADGRPQSLILRGENGQPGRDGMPGASGSHCSQGSYSAGDGSRGDDGESGGSGGNGGSVYAYVTDRANLRAVYVDSTPGRGAPGGRGGPGGMGGMPGTWERYECDPMGENCRNVIHYCSGGSPGYSGSPGGMGSDGDRGTLLLIEKENFVLPQVTTNVEITLAAFARAPVALSANVWASFPGAAALLAPGSIIRDTFYVYERTEQRQIALDWRAPRAIEPFGDRSVFLGFNGKTAGVGLVDWGLAMDAAVEGAESEEPRYVIRQIYKEAELKVLSAVGLSGKKGDYRYRFSEPEVEAPLPEGRFFLELLALNRGQEDLFNGEIPAAALTTIAPGLYEINLSKLGIDEKDLRPGRRLSMVISVKRQVGQKSYEGGLFNEYYLPR